MEWAEESSPASRPWSRANAGRPDLGRCVQLLQSCLTLCDAMDQPARLLSLWNSPGKNTGAVAMPGEGRGPLL